jgi:glycosyltransferase involved in cell wall biosynthesis
MASVDIVIPVYNEEQKLEKCVTTLREFLVQNLKYDWTIIIADNGSNDKTKEIGLALSRQFKDVRLERMEVKGRGWAIHYTWLNSKADIVSYMDVDLSTGLEAFPKLIQAISDGYDLASGSRLLRESHVTRSFKREFFSRSYNFLIKVFFMTRFTDAEIGFKAASHRAAKELMPLVKDRKWFFDTEMLLLASWKHFRIKDIPVTWMENTDSRLSVFSTVREYFKGLFRMRFRRI